jgi:hypothetical protein
MMFVGVVKLVTDEVCYLLASLTKARSNVTPRKMDTCIPTRTSDLTARSKPGHRFYYDIPAMILRSIHILCVAWHGHADDTRPRAHRCLAHS